MLFSRAPAKKKFATNTHNYDSLFPYNFTQKMWRKKIHTKKNACHISGKLFYPVLPNFTAGQKPHATMQFEWWKERKKKHSNLSTIIHSIFNGTIYFLRSSKKDQKKKQRVEKRETAINTRSYPNLFIRTDLFSF